ncbi:hypothetical protein DEU56DRAFT_778222 [Suillus clintonianus]|uniref:uncharacterized protein n=1 Tax=Suillus clintonianus TaxID=1904413 RepID=UPI001B85C84E|nr:uncharacterized protein DEU56DRAFT_778222 [Suillus clintonianus]KAG2151498.1 hypothetical protein DEU56DRAFT_778222 [Suillus clintonianus]
MVVLSYLVVFRTASLLFAMAWAFLGTCGFIFFLGVNPVDYWMIIAGSRDMQALALRGVVAFILWSGFALGYLLSTQL